MKARPILFNADMVRALLDGSKTQTRRPLKIQPPNGYGYPGIITNVDELTFGFAGDGPGLFPAKYPYGKIGDLFYVRENFQPISDWYNANYKTGDGYRIVYAATDEIEEFIRLDTEKVSSALTPSIHMPRWASRITLEITDIRVEQVQDISEQDSVKEGIEVFNEDGILWYSGWMDGSDSWFTDQYKWHCNDPIQAFKELWDGIYFESDNGWEENPWVFITESTVIHENVDAVLKRMKA